jgi:hypothetical protein
MDISVDISLYPLNQDFEPPILAFIEKLRQSPFAILENPLSTQVYGEYDAVTAFLAVAMKETLISEEMCVFTMKFVKGSRL